MILLSEFGHEFTKCDRKKYAIHSYQDRPKSTMQLFNADSSDEVEFRSMLSLNISKEEKQIHRCTNSYTLASLFIFPYVKIKEMTNFKATVFNIQIQSYKLFLFFSFNELITNLNI